jgi:hypothetical protein
MTMKTLLLTMLLILGGLPLRGQDYLLSDVASLKKYGNIVKKSMGGEKLTEAETDILIYGRGYINGLIDDGSQDTALGMIQPYALPATITNNGVALVILKYIESHPELMNRPACVVIGRALAETFPNPRYLDRK